MRHGFLCIAKPIGPTSHDIVAIVRKTLNERKIGHLGTLDPAASGLMVLAVGAKALKILEFFAGLPKEYEAVVEFGTISSTYDREGALEALTPKPGWKEPERPDIVRIIEQQFTGQISQVPPIFSALKIDGTAAYNLARKGKEVQMKERTVDISACEILEYDYPLLRLRVACSAGTYIRSLAHDIGQAVRLGAYLKELHRTKIGAFSIQDALEPTKAAWGAVIPLKEVLKDLPKIELTSEELNDISHGRFIKHQVQMNTIAWHDGLPVAVLCPVDEKPYLAKPRKVL